MAKVDRITGENIERFRGKIDFYMWKGKIPVARSWPKKPKPPYTALQAEAMAAFSITCSLMRRLSPEILSVWQIGAEGKREQWTDTFKGLGMKYWKLNREICPVAIYYQVMDAGATFKVLWKVLQVYLDGVTPEVESIMTSDIITKADLTKTEIPAYYTLIDDSGTRLIAPLIKMEA
jgi:hypothetical protein